MTDPTAQRLSPSGHVDTFARENLPPFEDWPVLVGLETLGYPDRLNAAVELVDTTMAAHGSDRPALTGVEQSWTYGELAAVVQRAANVLVDAGVVPGNRVLLRGPNNPWLAIAWLAVVRVGGVVVTTMPMLRMNAHRVQSRRWCPPPAAPNSRRPWRRAPPTRHRPMTVHRRAPRPCAHMHPHPPARCARRTPTPWPAPWRARCEAQ